MLLKANLDKTSLKENFNIDIDIIDNTALTFFLYQLSNVLDFTFFILALTLNEKKLEIESKSKDQELKTVNEELINVKKLVENDSITLQDKSKVYLSKLLYIKADDHYLNIITIDNKKHFVRGKLNSIALELPPNFVKCHKSYIVNKNHIKLIGNTFIKMNNDFEVPISRNFKLVV